MASLARKLNPQPSQSHGLSKGSPQTEEPSGRLGQQPSGRITRQQSGRLGQQPSGRLAKQPSSRLAQQPSGRGQQQAATAHSPQQQQSTDPPNRADAVNLRHALQDALASAGRVRPAVEEAYRNTLVAIRAQVSRNCVERGDLLEEVQLWYDSQLAQMHAMFSEIKTLTDEVCAGWPLRLAALPSPQQQCWSCASRPCGALTTRHL